MPALLEYTRIDVRVQVPPVAVPVKNGAAHAQVKPAPAVSVHVAFKLQLSAPVSHWFVRSTHDVLPVPAVNGAPQVQVYAPGVFVQVPGAHGVPVVHSFTSVQV